MHFGVICCALVAKRYSIHLCDVIAIASLKWILSSDSAASQGQS